ncbi:MAG TPA: hypothetical protein VFS00_28400 [Polyangiaceae bacterium]|nr:hypothetical protein [Polyangiaceae bacterium]
MPRRPLGRLAAAAALAALAAAPLACNDDDEAPELSYALDFPSEAAAIATESVTVYLFPSGTTDCLALIDARTYGKDMPAGAQSATASVCELRAGVRRAEVTSDAEEVTLLAVAQRVDGGSLRDYLIGCTKQRASEPEPLSVSLTFIDYQQSVPPTTCPTLSSRCDGLCPGG